MSRRAASAPGEETGDPERLIGAAVASRLGNGPLAAIVTDELRMLYYAFFAWGTKRGSAVGRAFSYHRDCNWIQVIGVVGALGLLELVFVHLLLSRWSAAAAWVATGLTIYGLVWLVADLRAILLNPLRVTDETVHVRIGLRYRARLSRSAIVRVRRPSALEAEPAGFLNAALIGDANVWLEFEPAARARTFFGVWREFRVLGLAVDDPAGLIEALATPADPD